MHEENRPVSKVVQGLYRRYSMLYVVCPCESATAHTVTQSPITTCRSHGNRPYTGGLAMQAAGGLQYASMHACADCI